MQRRRPFSLHWRLESSSASILLLHHHHQNNHHLLLPFLVQLAAAAAAVESEALQAAHKARVLERRRRRRRAPPSIGRRRHLWNAAAAAPELGCERAKGRERQRIDMGLELHLHKYIWRCHFDSRAHEMVDCHARGRMSVGRRASRVAAIAAPRRRRSSDWRSLARLRELQFATRQRSERATSWHGPVMQEEPECTCLFFLSFSLSLPPSFVRRRRKRPAEQSAFISPPGAQLAAAAANERRHEYALAPTRQRPND